MGEGDAVSVVRQALAAFNRRDFEAVLGLMDPEISIHESEAGPHAGRVVHGLEGAREYMRPDAFAEQRFEPQELIENGERVLAIGIGRARGAGSGAELEMDVFQVWKVRERRVIEYWTFADRELAYRTAGLERPDPA